MRETPKITVIHNGHDDERFHPHDRRLAFGSGPAVAPRAARWNERAALVELLAHLAELDTRRSLYAAEGYGSLFAYCTRALGLSEDAAYRRIEAARACRRFPAILDRLADGSVTLTAVRMLARHLTAENHAEVLAAARRRTKEEIEALVARLAPRPDANPVIRRLADRLGHPEPNPAAGPLRLAGLPRR